jgi:hypothetical protein
MNLNNLLKIYEKHKTLLIVVLILFIAIALFFQLYMFFEEKINEKDMRFDYFGWTESCDGTVYTIDDHNTFCQKCYDEGGAECNWPLDMNITVTKVEQTINTGGEVHCYTILDGVNLYFEKGSYYGLENNSLFTWEVVDATKPHSVNFCCGVQRDSPIATLLGFEKKWPQSCITNSVPAKCT